MPCVRDAVDASRPRPLSLLSVLWLISSPGGISASGLMIFFAGGSGRLPEQQLGSMSVPTGTQYTFPTGISACTVHAQQADATRINLPLLDPFLPTITSGHKHTFADNGTGTVPIPVAGGARVGTSMELGRLRTAALGA